MESIVKMSLKFKVLFYAIIRNHTIFIQNHFLEAFPFFAPLFLIGLFFLAALAFLTFGALTFGAFVFLAGDLAGDEAATGAGAGTATGATFATLAAVFLGALVAFGFDAGFLDADLF